MNSDQIDGTVRNFTGKAKDAVGGLAGDAKLQGEGKIDKMTGSGQTMYGDARDAIEDGIDQAGSMASDAASAMSDAARRAGAKVSDLGDRAYNQAAQASRYAGERVQEQPLAALMLAGLVGGIIGALLTSRR